MFIQYELRVETAYGFWTQRFKTREEAAERFRKDYPEAYFIREEDSPVTKCFRTRKESFKPSGYIGSISEVVVYVGAD